MSGASCIKAREFLLTKMKTTTPESKKTKVMPPNAPPRNHAKNDCACTPVFTCTTCRPAFAIDLMYSPSEYSGNSATDHPRLILPVMPPRLAAAMGNLERARTNVRVLFTCYTPSFEKANDLYTQLKMSWYLKYFHTYIGKGFQVEISSNDNNIGMYHTSCGLVSPSDLAINIVCEYIRSWNFKEFRASIGNYVHYEQVKSEWIHE